MDWLVQNPGRVQPDTPRLAVDGGPTFVAASAGNHAQGVALAATRLGMESTIVHAENAPQAKVDATREYGATVDLVGGTFKRR